ncbi:MAG: hypothetical protein K1X86_14200 [Ignavibacteria bacterium]|nr:hypothetical protein [Ignavibacteria bacterium]
MKKRFNNREKCRLCLNEKKICNSHLISEFFYKTFYEKDSHKFVALSPNTEEDDKLIEQKGIREYLLCKECETLLSRYERYAAEVITKIQNSFDINQAYEIFNDIDYKKFKMFELSILWRASISKTYVAVNLLEHEDIIREMLLNGNPGKFYEYGCIVEAIVIDGEFTYRSIIEPFTSNNRIEDHSIVNFIFGGFLWSFCIGKNSLFFSHKKSFLQEDNSLPIIRSSNETNTAIVDFHINTVKNPIVKKKIYNNNIG